MSRPGWELVVDGWDGHGQLQPTTFDLEAGDLAEAEVEAQAVFDTFPERHSDRSGRLYHDGVLVKNLVWPAVPW